MKSDAIIHSYHCGCMDCDFESTEWPIRMQRDSTCAGEVITRPFSALSDGVVVMQQLQEAAVAADAEPGLTAGFHVHVGVERLNPEVRSRLLWTWTLWEPVVSYIAGGRWNFLRGGMNRPTQREVYTYLQYQPYMQDRRHMNFESAVHGAHEAMQRMSADERNIELLNAYEHVYQADRHMALNIATRYQTWEFRLWNSTRSAWRMELWVRLSRLLASPRFMDSLMELPVPRWTTGDGGPGERLTAKENFLLAVSTESQPAADLLERQFAYLNKVDNGELIVPDQLTAV